MMFAQLLKIRYIAIVIVVLSVLHAAAFLIMGGNSALKGYRHLLDDPDAGGNVRPGLELLHSIDYLFISLVLVILSLGIAKLFLLDPSTLGTTQLPGWLHVEDISELKVLLWETILTTLLIIALPDLTTDIFSKPDWTVLLIPAAILILALSLYFMKKA